MSDWRIALCDFLTNGEHTSNKADSLKLKDCISDNHDINTKNLILNRTTLNYINENNALKNLLGITAPPKFLIQKPIPYTPHQRISTFGPWNEREQIYDVTLHDPRAIFNPWAKWIQDFVKDKGWATMNSDDKAREIWRFVIENLKYEYDVNDDWRSSITTFNLKKSDCEDSSILFIDLCRAAGIPANRIFMGLGWVKDSNGKELYGHAYPVYQQENGCFYIYESTLDFVPNQPMRFLGSNYDCSFGLCNDQFEGMVEGDQI